jgi:hypothetical protein
VLSSYQNNAVFDAETGLVWERAHDPATRSWFNAQNHRIQRTVGNRNGWRLPTVQELASLRDPTVPAPGPLLPPGHPFTLGDVQSAGYWSATSFDSNTTIFTQAWLVSFAGNVMFVGTKQT